MCCDYSMHFKQRKRNGDDTKVFNILSDYQSLNLYLELGVRTALDVTVCTVTRK